MDPSGNYQNRRLAATDISLIFEGAIPRLIIQKSNFINDVAKKRKKSKK